MSHNFTQSDDDDNDTSGSGSSGSSGNSRHNNSQSNSGPGSPSGSGSGSGSVISALPPFGGSNPGDVPPELINYNERFAGATPALYRDTEISATIAALISHRKPNALLVGPAGVGKTHIVEEIARMIVANSPALPDRLRDCTVMELPLSAVVAGSSHFGELEQKVERIIDFATDPKNKIILFMDEIHQLSGDKAGHGGNTVSQQLKPALARGDLHMIGATTTGEMKALNQDPAFMRRFTTITVGELNHDQTVEILRNSLNDYLAHHGPTVTVDPDSGVLEEITKVASQELTTLHRPDSALTLLDRALSRLVTQAAEFTAAGILAPGEALPLRPGVLPTAVRAITGRKDVAVLNAQDIQDQLERIVGQGEVTSQIPHKIAAESLRLFQRSTPLAWLFAGTSGVGKTETATIVSHQLTGEDPIRIDCAELSESHQVARLIGSPPGYAGSNSAQDLPFEPLMSNPRRVILLDEFEKAHPNVRRLFMGMLDNGTMSMSSGRTVDFSNAIVIATTNAASEIIGVPATGFAVTPESNIKAGTINRDRLTKALSKHFEPALLGRFEWLIAFNRLTKDNYAEIISNLYMQMRTEALTNRPNLEQLLPEKMSQPDITALVDASYTPEHGARPAQRAVSAWITDVATKITTPTPEPVQSQNQTPTPAPVTLPATPAVSTQPYSSGDPS